MANNSIHKVIQDYVNNPDNPAPRETTVTLKPGRITHNITNKILGYSVRLTTGDTEEQPETN